MKNKLLALCALTLASAVLVYGQSAANVNVVKNGVVKQISRLQLEKDYPVAVAQRADPGQLRADAIVGWYDKGNAYHEQKMEKNLGKDLLKEKIQEKSQLKGKTLR
jgi:hypothetical protein